MRPQDLAHAIDGLTPSPHSIGQVRGTTDDGRYVVRVGARGQDIVCGTHGSTHDEADPVLLLEDAGQTMILAESPYLVAADMTSPLKPPEGGGGGPGTPYVVADWDYPGGNYIFDAITANADVAANLAATHARRHLIEDTHSMLDHGDVEPGVPVEGTLLVYSGGLLRQATEAIVDGGTY